MSMPLFLFCGGPAIYGEGVPKPLMKVNADRSLLVHFLQYLRHHRAALPSQITLLCDDGQQKAFEAALEGVDYPLQVHVKACGPQASTLQKFERALMDVPHPDAMVQFGYPDIFHFGDAPVLDQDDLGADGSVHISAAALTSRFPRLVVDVYNKDIKGISNYSGPVPANPMHVFGGDLWGRAEMLSSLCKEFREQVTAPQPSLEYDFFFWLVNHKKMRCVMLHGERLWVDSPRDVHHLLSQTRGLP